MSCYTDGVTNTHWLTEADIAERIGVKAQTIRTYRWDGRIAQPDTSATDGSPLWSEATVATWIDSRPGVGQYTRAPASERLARLYVVDASTGCWNWIGHVGANGYGNWRGTGGKRGPAHRRAWEVLVGPISPDLYLDHLCLNKRCINPSHLEPVTPQENTRRWADTVTECPQGHAYTDENTRLDGKGKRGCRECQRASFRAWYHERGGAERQRERRAELLAS